MTVIEYCTEEVERQGHDTSVLDGIHRVAWMLEAWAVAIAMSDKNYKINITYIENLGKMIERDKNREGFRTCGVRVGTRVCPPWPEVVPLLKALFERRDELTPLEFYKEFQMIHPFRDGNGRTGKVIYCWMLGKLLTPEFPPNDLFGDWIANP